MKRRIALACIAALTLSACGGRIIPASTASGSPVSAEPPVAKPVPATPVAPVPVASSGGASAVRAGVVAGPNLATFTIAEADAARSLTAFKLSCPSLMRRADASGLTSGEHWRPACTAAAGVSAGKALAFFRDNFELAQVGDGKAFATGYYEPEIAGSRDQRPGYDVPIYKRPPDLVEVDLGQFSDDMKGKKIRGRVQGTSFVPYPDRTQIETGALAGRGLELAWAADAVEFFFLQVQGSGRLKLPDGSIMRIGYDSQNGRDYTGIGRLMRDRGLLAPGQASMQGLMAWLRANPEQGKAIMRENKSWVFFRELTGPGPLGAMGLPVVGKASIAADPAFIPLGAPVLLSMDRAEANGIWIAQDTGGAIKGANRVDTFWGAGADARSIAGGMSARGTAFLLLPKGSVARLAAQANASPQP